MKPDSLLGSLTFRGSARGWLDSLLVRGALDGRELYMNGNIAHALTGSLALASVSGHTTGTVSLRADTVVAAGLRVRSATFGAQMLERDHAHFDAGATMPGGAALLAAGDWFARCRHVTHPARHDEHRAWRRAVEVASPVGTRAVAGWPDDGYAGAREREWRDALGVRARAECRTGTDALPRRCRAAGRRGPLRAARLAPRGSAHAGPHRHGDARAPDDDAGRARERREVRCLLGRRTDAARAVRGRSRRDAGDGACATGARCSTRRSTIRSRSRSSRRGRPATRCAAASTPTAWTSRSSRRCRSKIRNADGLAGARPRSERQAATAACRRRGERAQWCASRCPTSGSGSPTSNGLFRVDPPRDSLSIESSAAGRARRATASRHAERIGRVPRPARIRRSTCASMPTRSAWWTSAALARLDVSTGSNGLTLVGTPDGSDAERRGERGPRHDLHPRARATRIWRSSRSMSSRALRHDGRAQPLAHAAAAEHARRAPRAGRASR